jgi:ribosome-binding protein aMBF1 (putative translation factor)
MTNQTRTTDDGDTRRQSIRTASSNRQAVTTRQLERCVNRYMTMHERIGAVSDQFRAAQRDTGSALRKARENQGLSRADLYRASQKQLTIAKIAGMEFGHLFTDEELLQYLRGLGFQENASKVKEKVEHRHAA